MTREEEIKKASCNADNYNLSDINADCISFQDGANWADSHPKWHKFPEEKPDMYDSYLCFYDSGVISFQKILDYFPESGKFCGHISATGEWTECQPPLPKL